MYSQSLLPKEETKQTVKAGKKFILGWSCDFNIKHMREKRNKKKKKERKRVKHVAIYPKGDFHLE